jgi:hypothetical protein
MPNAIDQRLASLAAQNRVETLDRNDRLTDGIAVRYGRMGRQLLRLAAVPDAETFRDMADVIDKAYLDVDNAIGSEFRREIRLSHRGGADALIDSIPWSWFRAINPMVLEVKGEYFHVTYGTVFTNRSVAEAAEPSVDPGDAQKRALIESLIFPDLAPVQIEVMLTLPFNGMSWDERLRRWEGSTRESMLSEMAAGLSAGELLPDLRKRLEPLVGGITFKAQRIARTEGRRMAERGQQGAYTQASDLLAGMQAIETLDEHTRASHAARHGRVYDQQADGTYKSKAGELLPDFPDEPNCRGYASPLLKLPAEFEADPAVRVQFETANAAIIPDPGSYRLWWAQATERQKRRSVGAARFRTVQSRTRRRDREPDWEDFLDDDGKLLSIARLKHQSVKAWNTRRQQVDVMIGQRETLFRQMEAGGFEFPKTR